MTTPATEVETGQPVLTSLPAMDRFAKRKRHHSPVAAALGRSSDHREMGQAIANCASALEVLLQLPEGADPMALLTGYRPCNRRLCPMCGWRRAAVWRTRLCTGLGALLEERPTDRLIFATFTVRNVRLSQLGETITEMHRAWKRLTQWSGFPSEFWFRRTEVTVGASPTDRDDPGYLKRSVPTSYDLTRSYELRQGDQADENMSLTVGRTLTGEPWMHPHIHALLVVPASYFGKGYIKKSEWTRQWMMAARLDYQPIVDIRAARAKEQSGTLQEMLRDAGQEAAKYITKHADVIALGDDAGEFATQIGHHRLTAVSRALGRFVPGKDPNAAELADERLQGLAALHPSVACAAHWDAGLSHYVLTPR